MEPAILGLVLDSSIVITAERRRTPVKELLRTIFATHGNVELSLSPVTIAELVHGIYRAKSPEMSQRRREYVASLVALVPLHPMTLETAFMIGRIEGEEAAKGNILPFNDLAIGVAALEQGYAVLTLNRRHFEKIPGLVVLSL